MEVLGIPVSTGERTHKEVTQLKSALQTSSLHHINKLRSFCKGNFYWQPSVSYNTVLGFFWGGGRRGGRLIKAPLALNLLCLELLCDCRDFCNSFSSRPGY